MYKEIITNLIVIVIFNGIIVGLLIWYLKIKILNKFSKELQSYLIRYSKLHEERVLAIKELFSKMVDAYEMLKNTLVPYDNNERYIQVKKEAYKKISDKISEVINTSPKIPYSAVVK